MHSEWRILLSTISLCFFALLTEAMRAFSFQESISKCPGLNEEVCPHEFCFDRTCSGYAIPGSQQTERPETRFDSPPPTVFTPIPFTQKPTPNIVVTTTAPDADHMYTVHNIEVSNAMGKYGYDFEGAIGRILTNPGLLKKPCPRLKPLKRYYEGIWAKNHFYTCDEAQGRKAEESGYQGEGITGYCVVFSPGCGAIVGLHRFWNEKIGDHIYVTKMEDYRKLIGDGDWKYEGVECYIWPNY